MNSEFKIGICIPTRDVWKPDFGQSLAMAGAALWPLMPDGMYGSLTVYNKTYCSIIHQGRNTLVSTALLQDCTHILFLDDDMRFPMDTIAKLFLADKDVIAANCTTKTFPAKATAVGLDGEFLLTKEKSTGLEKCQSVGAAVMMVKAEVFKSMMMPWFNFEFKDEPRMFDPLKSLDDNKMSVVGEDIYFCRNLIKQGYDIWIDHDVSKMVCHIGDWPYGHTIVPGYKDTPLTEEDILRTGT